MLILALILVITPALFIPQLPEAFEFIKTYLIIILALLGVLQYLLFRQKKSTPIWQFNSLAFFGKVITTFLSFYIFSTVLSVDLSTSIVGYPGRFAGSFLFIFSIVSFLFFYREKLKDISEKNLIKLIALSSTTPVVYGYLQILNLDFIKWQSSTERVFSTFGQPNWFAAYLIVVLFCLIYLLFSQNYERSQPIINYPLPIFRSFSIVGSIIYALVFILFLQTKSISGLITFFITYFLAMFWFYKKLLLKRYLITGVASFVLLLVFGSSFIPRLQNQVSAYDFNQTIITEDTGKIRLILWKSSLQQFLDTPHPAGTSFKMGLFWFSGSGPETFAYAFERPVELNDTSEWGMLFNKPHNFFIEELFELGVLGLAFYLYITYFFVKNIVDNYFSVLGLSILISSFFGWPSAYLYFLLFLFLFRMSLFYKSSMLSKKNTKLHIINPKQTLNSEIADSKLWRIVVGLQKKTSLLLQRFCKEIPDRVRDDVKNGLIPVIFISCYFVIFALSILFTIAYFLLTTKPCVSSKLIPVYQEFVYACGGLTLNEEILVKSFKINPKNKLVAEKAAVELFSINLETSEKIFTYLYKKEPLNPIYNFYKGGIAENKGDLDEALEYYKTADELVPNYFAAHEALGRLKLRIKN